MADIRARGYSLILLGLCAAAMAGWIMASDGPDRSQRQAARHRLLQCLCGRHHDLIGPAGGGLLATPYVLDYDLVAAAVAIAFFARHGLSRGFRPFEISVLGAAWIVPLLSRGLAGATGLPLGLLVLLATYGFILRRAVPDRQELPAVTGRIAQASLILFRRLARSFARLQCGRGFRLFLFVGPCDPSASASLFSRVAG